MHILLGNEFLGFFFIFKNYVRNNARNFTIFKSAKSATERFIDENYSKSPWKIEILFLWRNNTWVNHPVLVNNSQIPEGMNLYLIYCNNNPIKFF